MPRNGDRAEDKQIAASDAAAAMSLKEFMSSAGELAPAGREVIVDQARVMIEQAYVHLPLKRAMHAVDPIQRLKLLRQRMTAMSDRQFHDEMISIFTGLRDLHTNYELPQPYQGKIAFLPFLVEEFTTDSGRRYMVSKVFAGFDDPHLKPGVVLTQWNGIPIDRAVELNGDRQAGSNLDARRARGLEALTIRSMGLSSPPDEEWVIVGFDDGTSDRELRIPWRVFEPEPSPVGVDPKDGGNASATQLGFDAQTESARRAKKALFAPAAMLAEHAIATASGNGKRPAKAADDLETTSTMPDVLSFKTVTTAQGDVGYLRIWSFMVDDPGAFVLEVARIIDLLPSDGLIIDVRGNGGGVITAGEGLLQLFTPRSVEPSRLHFLNSPLTLRLAEHNDWLAEWEPSIRAAVETGEVYSQGFGVVGAGEYNGIGQRYQGPVVLIIDALCYSTTDIFSAGFADHHVGSILGTSGNTGAGGANVWTHELLQELLPKKGNPFKELPNGASMRVAIRRTTRVGEHEGVPVEDLGVAPDAVHQMTQDDLLHDNRDLLEAAGELLAQARRYELSARIDESPAQLRMTVTTKQLDRLDVYVDGRPRLSADVRDGANTIEVPIADATAIRLCGFDAGELVVSENLEL